MTFLRKIKLIILFGVLFVVTAEAQQTSFTATMDSSLLMIGEQSLLRLSLTTGKDNPASLPVLSDTIMKGIEIVEIFRPDTTHTKEDLMVISQNYMVTSFDSGLYYIRPFDAIDGEYVVQSNPLMLKVFTVPIDTASIDMMRDIKGVMAPKFVLADYYFIFLTVWGIFLFFAAIYYIIYYLRRDKNSVSAVPEILLPPHVVALNEFGRIKEEKLWLQGREKDYFTQLTDTVRHYIDRRFGVDAPEMTSGEILFEMQKMKVEKENMKPLKQILELADLVKFAKFKPLADESNLSLINAFAFVEATKQEEPEPSEKEKEPGNDDEPNESKD